MKQQVLFLLCLMNLLCAGMLAAQNKSAAYRTDQTVWVPDNLNGSVKTYSEPFSWNFEIADGQFVVFDYVYYTNTNDRLDIYLDDEAQPRWGLGGYGSTNVEEYAWPLVGVQIHKNGLHIPESFKIDDIPAGKHVLKFRFYKAGSFNYTPEVSIANLMVTTGNIKTIDLDTRSAQDGIFCFQSVPSRISDDVTPAKDAQGRSWFEEDYDDSTWKAASEMGESDMWAYNIRMKFDVGTPSVAGTYRLRIVPPQMYTDNCTYYVNGYPIVAKLCQTRDYYHAAEIPAAYLHEGDNVLAYGWKSTNNGTYKGPQIKIYANNINFDQAAQEELQQDFESEELIATHPAQLAEAKQMWNAIKSSLNGKDDAPVAKLASMRELIRERCRMSDLLPVMPEGKEKDALQTAMNDLKPATNEALPAIRQKMMDAKIASTIAFVVKNDMEDPWLDDKAATATFAKNNHKYTLFAAEKKAKLVVDDAEYEDVIQVPEVVFLAGDPYVVSMLNVGKHKHAREIVFPEHLASLSINSIPNKTSLVVPSYVKYVARIGGQSSNDSWYELKELTILGSECRLGAVVLKEGRLNLPNMKVPAEGQESCLSTVDKTIIHVPEGAMHAYTIHPAFSGKVIVGGEEGNVVHTGVVTPGELGFLVLSEAETLGDVNTLIIDSGDLDETDWRVLKDMPSLIAIDMSGTSIKNIPNEAFYDRWAIQNYKLPRGLESIGNSAFRKNLFKSIELPATLKTIGNSSFKECTYLEQIEIPDQVTKIDGDAFWSCSNLQHVTLGKSLETMGTYAFYRCDLRSVELPGTLKNLSACTFRENRNLVEVIFNEGLSTIGESCFEDCDIHSLDFPASLEVIMNVAFSRNYSLSEINFKEGLRELNRNAFNQALGLTSVVLPSTLQDCKSTPFKDCSNLLSMDCRAVAPPDAGNEVPVTGPDLQQFVFKAPEWGLANYKLATGWNKFLNFESDGILPQFIVLNQDFHLVVSDDETDGYTPDIELRRRDTRITGPDGQNVQCVGNLTVSSRSKLSANSLKLNFTPSNANMPTRMNRPNSLVVNGEMRAESLELSMMMRRSCWDYFTVPFDTRVRDIVLPTNTIDYVIYGHDGAAHGRGDHANAWVFLEPDDVLEAGKGYIINWVDYEKSYGDECMPFLFKPDANSANRQAMFRSDDRVLPLGQYPGEFAHNINWNFLGNPYPSYYDSRFIDIDAPIVVWDYKNSVYKAYSLIDDNYVFVPGESFFVQAPVGIEQLTFAKEGRQTHYMPRNMETTAHHAPSLSKRMLINLVLQHGQQQDQTRIVLNEQAEIGYEMGRDAGKIRSNEASAAQLFTLQGNTEMAINERPVAGGSIRLGIICPKADIYTISLQESDMQLVLVDHETSTRHLLTADAPYAFTASRAGTFTSRFELLLIDSTNGIEGVNGGDETSQETYNIAGQRQGKHQRGVIVTKGRKYIHQ